MITENMRNHVGKVVRVSMQPYNAGTARITSITQAHEYGRPDRLTDRIRVTVESIDMTETSRLMGATSTKPIGPGHKFDLFLYPGDVERGLRDGVLTYVYPV